MERYKIIIKGNVYEKLDEILDYYLRITFDFGFSKNIVDEIILTINSLSILPFRCPVYYKDYRIFIFKRYKIFYKVDEENKKVFIYYIFGFSEKISKKIFF